MYLLIYVTGMLPHHYHGLRALRFKPYDKVTTKIETAIRAPYPQTHNIPTTKSPLLHAIDQSLPPRYQTSQYFNQQPNFRTENMRFWIS